MVRQGFRCLNTLYSLLPVISIPSEIHNTGTGAISNIRIQPVISIPSEIHNTGTGAISNIRIQRYNLTNKITNNTTNSGINVTTHNSSSTTNNCNFDNISNNNSSDYTQILQNSLINQQKLYSQWLCCNSRRLPAFVINLDRRYDR